MQKGHWIIWVVWGAWGHFWAWIAPCFSDVSAFLYFPILTPESISLVSESRIPGTLWSLDGINMDWRPINSIIFLYQCPDLLFPTLPSDATMDSSINIAKLCCLAYWSFFLVYYVLSFCLTSQPWWNRLFSICCQILAALNLIINISS